MNVIYDSSINSLLITLINDINGTIPQKLTDLRKSISNQPTIQFKVKVTQFSDEIIKHLKILNKEFSEK